MIPIPGTSKVQHLEENIAAAGLKVDDSEWNNLQRAVSAK
jgi:pyridoxine 4-dehydrogenase